MSSHQASAPDAEEDSDLQGSDLRGSDPQGSAPTDTTGSAPDERAGGGRRVRPVLVWAGVGVFFVALQAYVLGRWLADGTGVAKAVGPDDLSGARAVIGVLVPVATAVPVLLLTAKYLWESRAQRRTSFDLLLVVGCVSSAWQDPMVNWAHPVVTVNTNQMWTTSSWGPYLPFWQGAEPHQQAEMPLHVFVAGLGTVLAAIGVCTGVRWLAERRPEIRRRWLVGFGMLIGMAIVATSEPFFPFLGFFMWSGATPGLTLFSGEWYQFPVYEVLVAGVYFAALGLLRYFVDARGETWPERGAHALAERIAGWRVSWVRLLAVVGFANVAYAGYVVGHVLFAWDTGASPTDLPGFFRPPEAY